MRRIVVFLPDEPAPRFMWAPIKTADFGSYRGVEHDSFAPNAKSRLPILENPWTGTRLPHTISLKYDNNFMDHYPTNNRAVANATHGKCGYS